ncbi:acyl-CoA dehydrogenase [Paraconexibacter algicola]|uniref:Acyl-CoA dehydrogenase n=2 Tax=Paraconexibacter algicola TaxID=2133960 RepID=A0A2T4UJW8_9ACTN|nr:acyl-CoA dehydrogenase [Paraconexibacter algicola]
MRYGPGMDLSYSDEQQFLREAVRGVVDRELALPRVREQVLDPDLPDVDHRTAHDVAVAQGWTGIGVPEEAGGQGGGLLELSILAEELGRGAVPADGLYATILAALALHEADGDADLLAALAGGERTGALLVGGDRPTDVAGAATCVLGAPLADVLVAPDGHVHEASATTVTPRPLADRTRALGDVAGVDAGATSTGLAAHAAVLVAADALGAAQRLLDLTVAYVTDRVQFGVPVGSFQAVKHTAADMLTAIEGTRVVVQYAAWAVGEDEPGAATDAWVAKTRAARSAAFVADKALFLHGAVGYTWEHDLQLLFKRAKSDGPLFGDAGTYDDRIADALPLT